MAALTMPLHSAEQLLGLGKGLRDGVHHDIRSMVEFSNVGIKAGSGVLAQKTSRGVV
jgi:hypothetical protein